MMKGEWRRGPAWHALFAIFAIALLCGSFAAGYGLTELIFARTGHPSEMRAHVASGFIGILLALAIGEAIHLAAYGNHHAWGRRLWAEAIDAFDRIARGDFDVFIQTGKYGHVNELIEKINKMASELGSMEHLRREFISNVSHEIQSPLTSIRGFAELLKNDDLSSERKNHYLDVIETESLRLSTLSDNLLKLSALDTGRDSLSPQEYRLDRQIENIALTMEPQWRAKNLQVEAELDKLSISGNPDMLSQVWINLLHNAVKFTEPGGKILIVLSDAGENICCRVSDTGVGISADDAPHVFERFYKADKARDRALGGNGLGLSIARKIVELHGGRIELESSPGEGSTFSVHLPRLHSV
ncbi:MAG: HAMP domain-containing histidine kinase [Synergistaceae bacterium]|jgi:signal transduction histidine kinase|nr:HAMP domain-containing histidine kinase [Synergistaceae bacterium]